MRITEYSGNFGTNITALGDPVSRYCGQKF